MESKKLTKNVDEYQQILKKYRQLIKEYHSGAKDFEFCNGYIIQATRNGLGYTDFEDGLVLFTKRKDGNSFVIVSSVGRDRAERIHIVAEAMWHSTNEVVYVKNVRRELESKLLGLGLRHYRQEESWNTQARYDDNTFPEQVVDVKKLRELQGPKYQSLREELNRFGRKYTIKVKLCKKCSLHKVRGLLAGWVENMHQRNGWDKKELHRSHEVLLARRKDFFRYRVNDEKNKPIGFLVFSEVSPQCLGYNALINDFNYQNLYRKLLFEGARIADEAGYHYLNLQGSEDEDQYLSKRRLKASLEIRKTHLVFEG